MSRGQPVQPTARPWARRGFLRLEGPPAFGDGNGADEEETEFDQEDPLALALPISFIFPERAVTVDVLLDLQGTVNARQELFDVSSDCTIADLKLACLSELARRGGDERDFAWVGHWSVVAFVWPHDQLLIRLTPVATADDRWQRQRDCRQGPRLEGAGWGFWHRNETFKSRYRPHTD